MNTHRYDWLTYASRILGLFFASMLGGCGNGGDTIPPGGGGGSGGANPSDACEWSIPQEAPAQGDYRAMSMEYTSGIGALAISRSGYRSVSGSEDGLIRLGSWDREELFTYDANADVSSFVQVNAVAMGESGRSFVAGSTGGRIYYFECDDPVPLLSYSILPDTQTDPDVSGVAISRDGSRFVAVAREALYFFRRNTAQRSVNLIRRITLPTDQAYTVSLNDDGTLVAVGTRPEDDDRSRVFLVNEEEILWEHTVAGLNGPGDLPLPVSISGDGRSLAVGGRDGVVKFFGTDSSTPVWTYLVPGDNSPVVAAIALAADGKRLVATGDSRLFYFDDTTQSTPSFEYDGTYDPRSNFGDPLVYPDQNPDATNDFIGNYPGALSMTRDGEYFAVGSFSNGAVFHFHRSEQLPLRVYNLSSPAGPTNQVSLSPFGAWIQFSGSFSSGELKRFEVAPVEILAPSNPIGFQIGADDVNPISGDVRVAYTIFKPGREATLHQHWRLYGGPGLLGASLVLADTFCSGNVDWNGSEDPDFRKALPEGSQVLSGTHDLNLPNCLASDIISESISVFFVRSSLEPENPSTAEMPHFSDATELVVEFSVRP